MLLLLRLVLPPRLLRQRLPPPLLLLLLPPPLLLPLPLLLLLLLSPAAASAATFDPDTGRLSLGDAPVSISFDDPGSIPAALQATFTDRDEQSYDATAMAEAFLPDPDGLEGSGALQMGGELPRLTFDLSSLWSQFAGRRVEIRFWQRPQSTRVRASLRWQVQDASDPAVVFFVAEIPFQPTGRATDDGWQEWTSGPVDFVLPNGQGPAQLTIEDVQVGREGSQYVTYSRYVHVLLDALQVQDVGPAVVPDAPCDPLQVASVCGPQGACFFGQCVDAALVLGPPLAAASLRQEYLARLRYRFETFEGSRMAHTLLDRLDAAVADALASSTPAGFWPRLREGVASLRDGHASAPVWGATASWGVSNLGVCVNLGEADLLPGGGEALLVFDRAHDNPVSSQLQVGDVLTAVDGLPPADWAQQLGLLGGHAGDPAAAWLVTAPWLLPAARQLGSVVTFTRCTTDATSPTPCDASELETIEIDFGALGRQTIWAGEVPDWMGDGLGCDYRFRRGVQGSGVKRYSFAGYQDEGPVRTLIINGLPANYDSAGQQWRATVQEALDPPPAYLILDQRTGHGGAIDTTDFIVGMLVEEGAFDRMEIVPWLGDRPLDAQVWDRVASCYAGLCGNFMTWDLHDMSGMDSSLRGVAATTRLAILNGLDVSGNDYTTRLLTYRSGPTRIFGGAPTYGAFGPIASLPAMLDEIHGGSMQLWDTIFVAAPDDPLTTFATGTGVSPDVRVLQRQSDALRGVDTTIEAAKAWLLQE